jgi:hypothetical protein
MSPPLRKFSKALEKKGEGLCRMLDMDFREFIFSRHFGEQRGAGGRRSSSSHRGVSVRCYASASSRVTPPALKMSMTRRIVNWSRVPPSPR